MTLTKVDPAMISAMPLLVVVTNSTGTHAVPAGAGRAKVYLKGPGGGGGGTTSASYGGGGGEGGERFGWVNVVPGATVTITLPAGGTNVAINTNASGGTPANSTWTDGTTTLTAIAGSGGTSGNNGGSGGIGGTAGSGGDYGMPGAMGHSGGDSTGASIGIHSIGGGKGGSGTGTAAVANSGGGGGGGTTGNASGAGGKGICVTEYWPG